MSKADLLFKGVACLGVLLGIVNTTLQWLDRRRKLTVTILSHRSDDDRGEVKARVTNPGKREIHVAGVDLEAFFPNEHRWAKVDEKPPRFTRPLPGPLPPETSSVVTFTAHDTFAANIADSFRVRVRTETAKVFTSAPHPVKAKEVKT
ncbi:MAG: hypothetical protein WAO57_04210 [Syntrophomonadaceae bacterium]